MINYISENWPMIGSWVCCCLVVVLVVRKPGQEADKSIKIDFEQYKD